MEESRRIHPTPKAISNPSPLEKGKPILENQPLFHPSIGPPVHSLARQPSDKRGCCCRVICCFISTILSLLVIIGILAAIFYFVYQPKAPKFSIDRLRITDLRLNLDLRLNAKFEVKIAAHNPNKKIGIYYEKGGKTSVWYSDTELCNGSIPEFYQGPQNTKELEVFLEGQNQYGNTLMSALQQQQQSGNVPLDLKVDQPVAIRVGSIRLGKVRCLVNCKLTVDSLSSKHLISIKTSSCSIKVKL